MTGLTAEFGTTRHNTAYTWRGRAKNADRNSLRVTVQPRPHAPGAGADASVRGCTPRVDGELPETEPVVGGGALSTAGAGLEVAGRAIREGGMSSGNATNAAIDVGSSLAGGSLDAGVRKAAGAADERVILQSLGSLGLNIPTESAKALASDE